MPSIVHNMEGYKNLEEKLHQMMRSLNESLKGSKGPNLVKGEFPKFYGFNSRKWIKDCGKYFSLFGVHEDEKVKLASHNMFDKARIWVDDYLFWRKSVYLDWTDFMLAVVERFKDEVSLDVLEQFKKLQQHGSVESYIDEFCALRSVMLRRTQLVPDTDILDNFLGGLQPDVKSFVEAFKPTSITKAIDYARLHFASSNSSTPKTCSIQFFSSKSVQPAPLPQFAPLPPKTKPPLLPTPTNNLNNQSILLLANSKPPLLPTLTNIKPRTSIHPLQFVPLTSNTKPPTYHTQLDTRKPDYILGCEEEKCVEISVERQCAKCSEVAKESEIESKVGTGPTELSEVVIEDKDVCLEREEIFEVGIAHDVVIREMLEAEFQSAQSDNQEVFGESDGEWSVFFDYKEIHSWGNCSMPFGLTEIESKNVENVIQVSISDKGYMGLVDLDGSERVGRIEVEGERLMESRFINKSLSALGDVKVNRKIIAMKDDATKKESRFINKSLSALGDVKVKRKIIAMKDDATKNLESTVQKIAEIHASSITASDVFNSSLLNKTLEDFESINSRISSEVHEMEKLLNSLVIEAKDVIYQIQCFLSRQKELLVSSVQQFEDCFHAPTHIRPPLKPPPKPPPYLVFVQTWSLVKVYYHLL